MADRVVVKMGYSRLPWRIVLVDCPAGEQHHPSGCRACETWTTEVFDHPEPGIGRTTIHSPVGFERKRDAVAWLAAQEAASVSGAAGKDRNP